MPQPPHTDRFEEYLTEGYYYGVEAQLLEQVHSAYQHIEILHHPRLGHMLRIDGALQCSEADEACYHEPLIHMTLSQARTPTRVLIIGGGDGGAAEEALKWPTVTSVNQMELDPAVLDLSRRYLRSLHHGLLDTHQTLDARYQLHIGDGLAHITQMQASGTSIDALVLDLTDPGGPSLPLWNADFFALCAAVLGDTGVLGLHIGAPWAQAQRCHNLLHALRKSFATVTPFITQIPVSGGPWMMAVAGSRHAAMPGPDGLAQQLNALSGAPLSVVDARILHAMRDLAYRW